MSVETALAVALIVTAAALLVWYEVRRPRPEARQRVPAEPIVLLHGLFGFDEVDIGVARREYFQGAQRRLEALGARVYAPRVAPAATIAVRANQLATQLRAIPEARIHIIAHSMGGLDARYAIAKLGLADRVVSLITVGTPHRGTPLADLGTGVASRLGLRKVLGAAGLDLEVFYDLTTEHMAAFNRDVPDTADVFYGSVLATAPNADGSMHPVLRPTHLFLERKGPNDGFVCTESQRWGEVLGEVNADHWAQIGWSSGFDSARLYVRIARALAARDT